MDRIVVKMVNRTWAFFVDGKMIEGGLFSKSAAEAAVDIWRAEQATVSRPSNWSDED